MWNVKESVPGSRKNSTVLLYMSSCYFSAFSFSKIDLFKIKKEDRVVEMERDNLKQTLHSAWS